jgi:hypothetical protein
MRIFYSREIYLIKQKKCKDLFILTVNPGAPVFPSLPGSPGGPLNISLILSFLRMSTTFDTLHEHWPLNFCESKK